MLLSSSTEQQSAIDQLRKENHDLKEHFQNITKEMQLLKETRTSVTVSSSKIRLPSRISVSAVTCASTTMLCCKILLSVLTGFSKKPPW